MAMHVHPHFLEHRDMYIWSKVIFSDKFKLRFTNNTKLCGPLTSHRKGNLQVLLCFLHTASNPITTCIFFLTIQKLNQIENYHFRIGLNY